MQEKAVLLFLQPLEQMVALMSATTTFPAPTILYENVPRVPYIHLQETLLNKVYQPEFGTRTL